jgi:branched-subunit amino acid ABC-type transport system permease component
MEVASQLIANGLIAGSGYGLLAVSFSLIYNTGRFFHFTHGVVYTAAAYITFWLVSSPRIGAPYAVAAAVAGAALLGGAIEVFVYRPLRARRGSPAVLLLASLGLATALQNVLTVVFGEGLKSLPQSEWEVLTVLGARLTTHQILMITVSCAAAGLIALVLRYTGFGRSLRAVADDPELALISGIDCDRMILLSFLAGSALAGVAGVLAAYDIGLWPTMGFSPLLAGVVGMVVGGVGNTKAGFLGGLVVGLVQQFGAWVIPSGWQDTVVFAILTILLVVRPHGIMGRPLRKATV